ncbi:MAG: LysR family transcriptional regulator, partial [Pseudomonadota bacterium]
DLPSLAALRAFEAAARCGSLSAAARELNVTHAAIAGHVRNLEAFFSTTLLTRAGQGMEPTPDGALLARGLTDGFTSIAATCRDLSDRNAARPLSVTTTPTFAENWLMPRLGSFWAHHPDVNVTINPSPEISDLKRDGHDIAIRYGDGHWPGLDVEPLLSGDFVVAAAPSLADRLPDTDRDTLRDQIWIMDHHRAEERYLAAYLDVSPDQLRIRTLATNGMVLSAARAGMGLVLQTRMLIQPDLEANRLQSVTPLHLDGIGYYLVTRPGTVSDPVAKFRRWLRRAV